VWPIFPARVSPHRLSDEVAQLLLERIREGRLTPGARLPAERRLAKTLGVSPPTIREALRTLEAMGVVAIQHGRGSFVHPGGSLGGVPLIGITAGWRSSSGILNSSSRHRPAGNGGAEVLASYVRLDYAIHHALADAARNHSLRSLVEVLGTTLQGAREATLAIPGRLQRSFEEHGRIIDAVKRVDAEASRAAIEAHVRRVLEEVRSVKGRPGRAPGRGRLMETAQRLRTVMAAHRVDAVVATSPDNVIYSVGFTVPSHLSNRFRRTIAVVPLEGAPALIVVTVEESLARGRAGWIADIRAYNEFTDDSMDLLAGILSERGLARGRVALELDHMAAADHLHLGSCLPQATFVHAAPVFFEARMHKTASEVEAIRRLGRLAARAHGDAYARLRPGMTERDLARLLIDACPGVDYCRPIVGAGERSALANAPPTNRPIARGDVIRVDLIAGKDWFHSDIARTAVVGPPTAEQARIWGVLIDAYHRVQDRLTPGTSTRDLHLLYLRTLADAGLEASLKFLGHGLGLTIHEEPYVNEYTDRVLEPGMVLCLEPMYLVLGRMGFHIEDEFLITDDGFETLSDGTPNDQLIEIGAEA
jgi:Xaa-Pro aminopeptidase/DNA-binding FadR family transcriptional regulator